MSCIVLLTPSASATDCYQDEEVHFQYRLIRIYEMDAREIMENNLTCLMPFVPLMRHGPELIVQAENRINDSDMPRKDRADMLTSMAILSCLISRELPKEMIGRRRDLMIESAAYDLLMELAREDVREEVMKEGIELGEKKGEKKGKGVSTWRKRPLCIVLSINDLAIRRRGGHHSLLNEAIKEQAS